MLIDGHIVGIKIASSPLGVSLKGRYGCFRGVSVFLVFWKSVEGWGIAEGYDDDEALIFIIIVDY